MKEKRFLRAFYGIIILVIILMQACQTNQPVYKDPAAPVDKRIKNLMKRMTLEEKINQLSGHEEMGWDEENLTGFGTKDNKRLGIPGFKMTDGPVGVRWGKSTAFPAGIGMAATWDTALIRDIGEALAKETLVKGRNYLLGGCVNIHRNPLGGRNFESFGEDPYLSSSMIVPYTLGIKSQNVVSCVKHYACNNQEWERNKVNMLVEERALREIYLPMYKAAVKKAGVHSVMGAYNLINGEHCTENKALLTDILKKEWGFNGFVISDWNSVHSTNDAAKSGLDLEMPNGKYFGDKLLEAVKNGEIEEDIIDDKVKNILMVKFETGLFDRATKEDTLAEKLLLKENRQLALEAAEKSIVLAKNTRKLLPLEKATIKQIAVIGPNAAMARTGAAGSSKVNPQYSVSPLEGIKNYLKNDDIKVVHAIGDPLISGELASIPRRFLSTPDGQKGLKTHYFTNHLLEGKPHYTGISSTIDFDFQDEIINKVQKKDSFSIRWEGVIKIPESREYTFYLTSDDGSRLYINEKLVIDNWGVHGPVTKQAKLNLKRGTSLPIKIEFNELGYGAMVQLAWDYRDTHVNKEMQQAIDLARQSDLAVVCIGASELIEGEGMDRKSLQLPQQQDLLTQEICKANPNTVVVVFGGTPMQLTNWTDYCKALLLAWYPGQEGGHALANILFGETNPSAKLPISYIQEYKESPVFDNYKNPDLQIPYDEGIFIGYRWLDKKKIKPLFPFGHGLSYTSFNIGEPKILKKGKYLFEIKLEVKNTGPMEGSETIQVYLHDKKSSLEQPLKQLKAYQKIQLKPDEQKTVRLTLNKESFQYYDPGKKGWRTEAGKFEIWIGNSSGNIQHKKTVQIQ